MAIVHGLDANKNVVPLLVDANGRVIVQTISGLAFSPLARSARYENLNLAAGTNASLTLVTVAAGEVWEVNVVGMRYTGTVATVICNMFINKGGVLSNIFTLQPPVSNKYEFAYCNIVMDAGDILQVTVLNATLNDDFVSVFSGRRIG